MGAKEVRVTQMPAAVKPIVMIHQEPGIIRILECSSTEDIYNLAMEVPLEVTAIASKIGGTINGYYMIGISVPNVMDTFKKPIIAYHFMSEADWRQNKDAIKAEVDRRKKLYMENKDALKNIPNSR